MTAINWTLWGAATGGQGRGTLNVNNCQPNCATGTTRSTPAVVVVFNALNGIFQDVSITPAQDVLNTPNTNFDDRSADHFDDQWPGTGRGVTTGFWVGRGIATSSFDGPLQPLLHFVPV